MAASYLVDWLYISEDFLPLNLNNAHRNILNEVLSSVQDLDLRELGAILTAIVRRNSNESLTFYKKLRELSESLPEEEQINIPLNPTLSLLNFFQTEACEKTLLISFVEENTSLTDSKAKYMASILLFVLYELGEYEAFLSTL